MKEKINEKNIPAGARKKMPFWSPLAWTSRNISQTINILLISYITFYCTDVLGLSVGIVSTMLLASKIVDALTDLGVGYLIDRTHTRWGKARPYEVFIIFQWIFTVLLFAVPNVSKTMQYVYIFIMYVIVNAICITALGAADSVYLSRAYTTDENRTKVLSVTGIVLMIASIAFSMVIPQFMSSEAGATQGGWIKMTVMLAIPLGLIGILRFIFVKEIVVDEPETKMNVDQSDSNNDQKITMKAAVELFVKNKFALIIIVMGMFTQIIQNMGSANTYYFKYIVGDVGMLSLVGMLSIVTPLILIFFPLLSRKVGTTKILQVSMLMGAVGILIRIVGGSNIVTIMVGSLINTISVIPLSVMINVYLIDCMDYGEWITGTRIEGLIASVNNFAGKVGGALATGLVGLIMGLAGYDGSLEVQSNMANIAIIALFNFLPFALYFIMFILSLSYKMDSVRSKMMGDLQKKREGNT